MPTDSVEQSPTQSLTASSDDQKDFPLLTHTSTTEYVEGTWLWDFVNSADETLTAAFNPDQECNEKGEWSSGGGALEGITVKPLTGRTPVAGYVVAREGTSKIITAERFFNKENRKEAAGAIIDFVAANRQSFTDGAWLGIWHDTKNAVVVLDVVDNVMDKNEAI